MSHSVQNPSVRSHNSSSYPTLISKYPKIVRKVALVGICGLAVLTVLLVVRKDKTGVFPGADKGTPSSSHGPTAPPSDQQIGQDSEDGADSESKTTTKKQGNQSSPKSSNTGTPRSSGGGSSSVSSGGGSSGATYTRPTASNTGPRYALTFLSANDFF